MASPQRHILNIPQQQGQQPLSAPQKKFNGLIRKIATQRELLLAWNEAIPLYQQKRAATFEPLLDTYRLLNLDMLRFLDQACDRKELGKNDRQLLQELICDLATGLMRGDDETEVKAIYNRHSASDFDADDARATDALKAMVEETLGVDLGKDAKLDSPEDLMQRLHEQLEAEQAREAEAREQRRRGRKPSAKQVKQQQEEQQATQSIREIYRKLVSALHPDREPDAAERARKTALMQRVNEAYKQNKLLDLLQLQLEIEQIDPQSLHTMSEERLLRYNRILADQLAELQHEVLATEHAFALQFGLGLEGQLTPANIVRKLVEQTHWLQRDIHDLQRERKKLDDIKILKRWIREQHREASEMGVEDFDLPDELLGQLFKR